MKPKKTAYQKVREKLLKLVEGLPEDRLAGYLYEKELQEHFQVGRNTLRHAVSLLCDEGILQRVHGGGIRVIRQSHAVQGGILIVNNNRWHGNQDSQFWWDLMNGIANAADAVDMFMEIRFFENMEDLLTKIYHAQKKYHLRAVVSMGTIWGKIDCPAPIIAVYPIRADKNIISVIPNYESGYAEIVAVLKKLGKLRFTWIGGPPEAAAAQDRKETFAKVITAAGLELLQEKLPDNSSWYELEASGLQGLKKAMSLRPDVIVAVNDHLARDVVYHLEKLGAKVPDNIRVIGLDNQDTILPDGRHLTTVAFNRQEMGKKIIAASLWPDRHMGKTLEISTNVFFRET